VVAQQAEHGAKEHGAHPPAQVMVPRQAVPQGVRQTQHPLSNRYVRDDVFDQMRGTFGHAATTAARTERAPLARERDEPVQATVAAVKPREPARQEPAPEECPKGVLDEPRHARWR